MRILILTYYFPPCNSIASLRPSSWAKEWSELNHDITVITRNWSSNDNNWDKFLSSSQETKLNITNSEKYKLIQIPYNRKKYPFRKISRKIDTLKNIISGNFNLEYNSEQFRIPCENEIKTNKPDFIIVSSPPLNLIKLGYELTQKYNLNFIADFRDYENFSTLKINPNNSIYRKIDLSLKNIYLKKWLSDCKVVSVATAEFASYFNKKNITKKAIEVTNGFESSLFIDIKEESVNDKFSIVILGSILPSQDSACFLNGFKLFLKENPDARVKIDFIGGQAIKDVSDLWSKNIPSSILNITPRIDRKLALSIGKKANILFYPGWKGYKGMYSGKIFDYLGLKTNILIAPNDFNTIERLVKETQSGKIANSSSEVKDQLESWYRQWENNGAIPYTGIEVEINKYTRENIAISLLIEIEKAITIK